MLCIDVHPAASVGLSLNHIDSILEGFPQFRNLMIRLYRAYPDSVSQEELKFQRNAIMGMLPKLSALERCEVSIENEMDPW